MRPYILDPLFASVKTLQGIGPRLSKLFEIAAGPKVVDLIWHLPSGIIDRRFAPKIADAPAERIATITVHIDKHIPGRGRNSPYRVRCSDSSGSIDLVFFHVKGDYLEKQLPVGETRIVSGKIEYFHGTAQMSHPDAIGTEAERDQIQIVEPVYPLTAGLTHKAMRKAIKHALEKAPTLPEWQDAAWIKRQNWRPWHEALARAHIPQSEAELDPQTPDRQRLAYDELLANQLTLALIRAQERKLKGRPLKHSEQRREEALKSLPFSLTGAQQRSLAEIDQDMADPARMLRLLQGDVGSGKTVVAFLAMLTAIENGAQAAIMAPTEILARQHAQTIEPLAEALGVYIVTLTGRDKGATRRKILEQIASGEADIVIGTHALFQKDVEFKDLAFIVIDEQHRFGVHQRLEFSEKGTYADTLVMTATPIPRTLTLTAYGDMEVSRLDEKPAGRLPIDTRLIPAEKMEEVTAGIGRKIAAGERVYWVCPLVEESEKLDLAAAEERFQQLSSSFPGKVGLIHGRMKAEEKDAIMLRFAGGETSLLVATTVVEVGVDVPEATVMVIEHAERFGLSQLHQLRGRVGRSDAKSACILLYTSPLGETAKERLQTIRDTEDGFLIAEKDLELRGAGEILGTRQSGLPEFHLADLAAHKSLLSAARDDAKLVLHNDAELQTERGQALRTLLYLFECDSAIKYLRSG